MRPEPTQIIRLVEQYVDLAKLGVVGRPSPTLWRDGAGSLIGSCCRFSVSTNGKSRPPIARRQTSSSGVNLDGSRRRTGRATRSIHDVKSEGSGQDHGVSASAQ